MSLSPCCWVQFQRAAMSRGGSYGGGQSSLGYLFGSDESSSPSSTSGKTKTASSDDKKAAETTPVAPSPKQTVSANNYHRAQGQNSGNFITVSSPHRLILQLPQLLLWILPYPAFIFWVGPAYNESALGTWRRLISWVLVWRQMTQIGPLFKDMKVWFGVWLCGVGLY